MASLSDINSFYIYLYFAIILLCVSNKLLGNVSNYISLILLMLFSGFRYDSGIDYFSYENMVLGDYPLDYIEYFSRLTLLLAKSYQDPSIYFLLSAIVYIVSLFYALKKFNSFNAFTVFLFTTFTLSYLTSFGFVRQYAATGFVFLSFVYLYEKDYKKYLLFVIVGTLFHFSALIALFPFLLRGILFKRLHVLLYLAFIILPFFLIDLIVLIFQKIPFISHYADKMLQFKFGIFGQKIFMALAVVFFVNMFSVRYLIRKTSDTKLILFSQNMIFVGLVLYSAFLSYGEHFSRVSYYFMPFYLVIINHIYRSAWFSKMKLGYFIFAFSISSFFYISSLYFAQKSDTRDFLNNYEFSIGKY